MLVKKGISHQNITKHTSAHLRSFYNIIININYSYRSILHTHPCYHAIIITL